MKIVTLLALVCVIFAVALTGCVDKDVNTDNIDTNSMEPSIEPTTDNIEIADETPTDKPAEEVSNNEPLMLYMADSDSNGKSSSRIAMDGDGTATMCSWPLINDDECYNGEWKSGGGDKYIIEFIDDGRVLMTINVKLLEDHKATFSFYYGKMVLEGTWEGDKLSAPTKKKQAPIKLPVNKVMGDLRVRNIDIEPGDCFLHVTGDIKNTGDTKLRLARAYMHLYNEDGRVIDSGMSLIKFIEPGDTKEFSISGDGNKYDDVVSYDVEVTHQIYEGGTEEESEYMITIATERK